MRLLKTKVWVPAWKVSFVENKFQVNAKLKWDGGRRAVGPVPILKCKIRVWKNGVATELVLFTSPHLTLRGKHTLKDDSSLLNNCWHKLYKIHSFKEDSSILLSSCSHRGTFLKQTKKFWSKKQLRMRRGVYCLVLINGRLEVLLSNYSYSW